MKGRFMENQAQSKMTLNIEKREIVFIYVFDAPRELVFKVYTDPKLVPQWWGPRSLTTTVVKMEVRPGGVWRFVQHDAGGNAYAFNGIYREIVLPERLVYTFEFEGLPGRVLLETVAFEDYSSKTKLTAKDVFQTVDDLNGMLKSGMEKGAVETFDRIAELLQEIQKEPRWSFPFWNEAIAKIKSIGVVGCGKRVTIPEEFYDLV
jgi:uncharacterized protein YndB with AHSA1/START domain